MRAPALEPGERWAGEGILRQIRADPMEARVRGLATPALIVWGDEDRVLNVASALVLHRLLPASRMVIMPRLGHMPMFEQPKQSADIYLAFRRDLPARKPRGGVRRGAALLIDGDWLGTSLSQGPLLTASPVAVLQNG